MNDKDEIKELFQKELGNYQAKVNPNLWNGIQAGLGTAGAATGAASSLGLIGKLIIGVSIASVVTVGTILLVNKENEEPKKEALISELKIEDTVVKEPLDQTDLIENQVIESSNKNKESVEKVTIAADELENTPKIQNRGEHANPKVELKKSEEGLTSNKIKPQENTVVSKKEVIIEEELLSNKINSAPTLIDKSTTKEELTSELDNVNIGVTQQDNQYVAFKVEEVPNDAYIAWDFGDGQIDRTLNPEHFYSEAGNYSVKCTIKTEREEITKTLNVEIKIAGKIGDLPNVFTPNGDSNNDEFFIVCENIKSFQLTIIDNQQNIIYSTNEVDFRWNGLDRSGSPAKEGTYYYIIVAEDESGNTINKYQQLRLQR